MKRWIFALVVLAFVFTTPALQAGEKVTVCDGNSCRLVDRPVVRIATAPVRAIHNVAHNVGDRIENRVCNSCVATQRVVTPCQSACQPVQNCGRRVIVKRRSCRLFSRSRCR